MRLTLLSLPVVNERGFREAPDEKIASYPPRTQLNWKVFLQFFTRPKIGRWILVLLVYMMGTTIANTMFRPFLVDLGLSLAQIGLINGIAAFSAGFVGSFVGGFLVKILGRKRSLITLGGGMAIANATFIIPTLGWTSIPILYLVSMGFQFAYSMACIPMYTVMMDKSRLLTAGFDYTLQISLVFVGSLTAGAISGFIANAIGYQGAFLISATLVLLSIVIIARVFDNDEL
ncbi:MFS transporter [Aphanothece hegewaldii]|uniref:MFS transporter n=1 Tax=Aphanothece hegewaldii TaxID=1521625 RepID=UPI0015E75637|nr:MFS transporter [Aphanothece hegewaldii]